MSHGEQVQEWFNENLWWLPNFHKVNFWYVNGFLSQETYDALVKLKIRKFNGKLARLDELFKKDYDRQNKQK